MMLWTAAAAAVYLATTLLGVTAALRHTRFGRWHHVMFFLSCSAAAAATVLEFHWMNLLPLGCLAALPFTRGGRRSHVVIGTLGALSWITILILRSEIFFTPTG